jgi:hypothetical protein
MDPKNFSGLGALNDLGARTGIDTRPTLLRVLTDLYVHRLSHTADEERHYSELALRLLDVVDIPTRVAVARRLARYLSPPRLVLQRLAGDVPEVAAELQAQPVLKPAVTEREAPVASALPDEPATIEQLGVEASGTLDAGTAYELNELLFTANAEARRQILLNADVGGIDPGAQGAGFAKPAVSEALERALLSGNREQFTHLLARALQIPGDHAQRVVRDELGEPIVVAAKVLRMPRDVLYRILLFVNPSVGHSVERVHALAKLYDEITVSAAETIVSIWQSLRRDDRIGTKYRPYVREDDARRRARQGVGADAARRNPIDRRSNERRNMS